MAADEHVGRILVGDTLSHGGVRNPVSDAADAFVKTLKDHCPVPIERAHEAWSSIEASRYAPENKQHDDSAAAAIILQRYFDMKGGAIQ